MTSDERLSIGNVSFQAGAGTALPASAHYIEHVYDNVARQATRDVIVGHGSNVYVSKDLGTTWQIYDVGHITAGRPVSRSFTLRNGDRVIQTTYPFQMFLVDAEFRLKATCAAGLYNWHGTWSIDQSSSGTIMYGEYFGAPEHINIWRSTDGGLTWNVSLCCEGPSSPSPFIRHFHTCQADPFKEGRWIASSGDSGPHNRMWTSEDDGVTWQEVGSPNLAGKEQLTDPRRAYRFTALQFSQDHIIWPTDDTLGVRKAGLIRASRVNPSNIEILGWLGTNEMRALIRIDTDLSIAISESKLDPTQVDLYLIEGSSRVLPHEAIKNASGVKTALTRTMCSKAACEGVFFSFDETGLSGERSRFAKWKFVSGA